MSDNLNNEAKNQAKKKGNNRCFDPKLNQPFSNDRCIKPPRCSR